MVRLSAALLVGSLLLLLGGTSIATSHPAVPVTLNAAPKWKLVQNANVTFSVRGSYVSGYTFVRAIGVKVPGYPKDKRTYMQKGNRGWVFQQYEPRNIRLLYRGQNLKASQFTQIDVEPALQYQFSFTPKGAAKPVFSTLGRGTGTLTFTTNAGPVRLQVAVRVIPYG